MPQHVIPSTLPTIKAELIALCKQAKLSEGGTVVELRKRLKDARDGDSVEEEGNEDSVSEGDDDGDDEIRGMTKSQLVAMAKRLGVESSGTKEDLLAAILTTKSEKKSGAREKDDGWKDVVLHRHGKVDITKVPLDWSAAGILLMPALWPVLLWREPIGRPRIFGPLGTDGDMLEALKKRWRTLLGCDEAAVEQVRGFFVTIWAVVSASRGDPNMRPAQWAQENWSLLVAPAVKALRILQSQKLERSGQARTARKVRALAEVPAEEVGYDLAEVIEKAATGRPDSDGGEDASKRHESVRSSTKRRRMQYRTGHCRKCGVKATPSAGQTTKEWYLEHNKTCK